MFNIASRLKVASVLALLGGPFLLVTNYQDTAAKKKIDREGIETVALPTAKVERRGRKGGRTYKLDIEYSAQGAGSQTARVDVSKDLYERIEAEPILHVKYLEEDPAHPIVIGEPLESPELNYAGGGALAFGLVGSWWFFLRKRRQSPAQEPSEPVTVA